MPVTPQIVEFPLAGGIDTKSDEKIVNFPSFLDIKNAVFTKHGSLKKRNGYTGLLGKDLDETFLSGKDRLAARKKELLAYGDGQLHVYSPTLDRWADRGNLPQWAIAAESVADRPTTQVDPAVATDGSIRVIAWLEGSTCYYTLQDVSGQTLQAPTALDSTNASQVKAVHTSTGVAVFLRDSSAADIWSYFFTEGNYTGTKTEYQLSDLDSDNLWDVCPLEGPVDGQDVSGGLTGGVALTYKESTNGGLTTVFLGRSCAVSLYDAPVSYDVGAYSDTGVPQGEATNFITSRCSSVSGGNDGHIYVLFGCSGTADTRLIRCDVDGYSTVQGKRIDDDNLATSGTFCFREAATATDNDTTMLFVYQVGNSVYSLSYSGYSDATPTGQTERFSTAGVDLASHLGRYSTATTTANDEWFFLLHAEYTFLEAAETFSGLQSSFMVVDSSFKVISVLRRGLSVEPTELVNPALIGTKWVNPVAVTKRIEVAETKVEGFGQQSIELLEVDTASTADLFAELRGSTYFGGTSLWQYDGAEVVESGFWFYPEVDKETIVQTGNNLDEGTYGNYALANEPYAVEGAAGTLTLVYYAVYEWTDAQGKLIQSAAVPLTVKKAIDPGTESLTFTFPEIPATNKSDVRGAVYRTHNDSTAIAYRVSDYPGLDLSSGAVTFTDAIAEADLKEREILYLSSGALDNVAPNAATSVLSHDDRIFYVDSKDPLKVRFSKRPDENSQPGFNEGLYIQVPPDGGDCTGLAVLDNKLVIFKRDRIYLVSGDGPNSLGAGAYSFPRLVSTDTGCKDANSIVRVPQGIMFQSDKGIYWLNRGEAVNYIGAPVEAYNAETVRAATLVPDKNLVIFLINGTRTLAFDYERGFWTTFTEHAGLGSVAIDGSYYYLRADGFTVWQMDSSYTEGDGGSITVEFTTPWIKPEGLQARWHCRRAAFLGNYLSTHDISVEVYFNYRSYGAYTQTWNPESALDQGTLGGNATLGGGDALGINDATKPDRVYQFQHILRDQRVESVKFVVTEVPPGSSPGASFEVTSLALEAAGYGDIFKLPGSKTI